VKKKEERMKKKELEKEEKEVRFSFDMKYMYFIEGVVNDPCSQN